MGIDLDGQVRWATKGNEMGIEFSRPELVVQALLGTTMPMGIINSGR